MERRNFVKALAASLAVFIPFREVKASDEARVISKGTAYLSGAVNNKGTQLPQRVVHGVHSVGISSSFNKDVGKFNKYGFHNIKINPDLSKEPIFELGRKWGTDQIDEQTRDEIWASMHEKNESKLIDSCSLISTTPDKGGLGLKVTGIKYSGDGNGNITESVTMVGSSKVWSPPSCKDCGEDMFCIQTIGDSVVDCQKEPSYYCRCGVKKSE